MLYRGNNRIHVCPTKNRPVFGPGSSFGEPQLNDSVTGQLDFVSGVACRFVGVLGVPFFFFFFFFSSFFFAISPL